MKKYWKFKYKQNGKIRHKTCYHFSSDYTLCGIGSDSSLEFEDIELVKMYDKRRITCSDCQEIIEEIKSL